MNTLANLAAAFVIAVIISGITFQLVPASFWFEVRAVEVMDASADESPRMVIDRSIHSDFRGDWVVTILKVMDNGFEPVCTATGSSDYSTTNLLPPNIDLDWWTWPTQCRMEPGKYIVRTVWTMRVLPMVDKTVRAVSNIFTISPEGTQDGDTRSGA